MMRVEEEETVMMKKKKNDDDDEEHGETNNNNSRNVLGKIPHTTYSILSRHTCILSPHIVSPPWANKTHTSFSHQNGIRPKHYS